MDSSKTAVRPAWIPAPALDWPDTLETGTHPAGATAEVVDLRARFGGQPADAAADLVIALILMLADADGPDRDAPRSVTWNPRRPPQASASEVVGRTLGVIGGGGVSQAVAARALRGLGMRVLTHDGPLSADQDGPADDGGGIDAMLPECDFVAVHGVAGVGPEAPPVIGARRLDLMKPTGVVLDVERRGAVDDRALRRALWFETIGGAGIAHRAVFPETAFDNGGCANTVVLRH